MTFKMDIIQPILDHMLILSNTVFLEYFINWLARLVQNPTDKVRSNLLFSSSLYFLWWIYFKRN